MKLANLLCIASMVFYTLELVIADLKLGNVTPRFLTFCYAFGISILMLPNIALSYKTLTLPSVSQWHWMSAMVLVSLLGALSHFAALHYKVGSVRLSLAYLLMPVVAAVIIAISKGQLPSVRLIVAWLFAILSLFLTLSSDDYQAGLDN